MNSLIIFSGNFLLITILYNFMWSIFVNYSSWRERIYMEVIFGRKWGKRGRSRRSKISYRRIAASGHQIKVWIEEFVREKIYYSIDMIGERFNWGWKPRHRRIAYRNYFFKEFYWRSQRNRMKSWSGGRRKLYMLFIGEMCRQRVCMCVEC